MARALGPTGGDGTARTPLSPRTGGGDPLTAKPREVGDPRATSAGPGLAGAAPLRRPAAGPGDVRDGPPMLVPGLGDRGGLPTAPLKGRDPLAGTAGSGDRRDAPAPMSPEGDRAPLAPTTPGPKLRPKPGPGLPSVADAPVEIAARTVDASRSGGGGGTAATPGLGGGGPLGAERVRQPGGGGSGLPKTGPQPGGVAVGPGPGGTGGGGSGLTPVGNGGAGHDLQPAATVGTPSVVRQPGRGEPDGAAVRPGKRGPGPGGPPAEIPDAPDQPKAIGPGGGGPGRGSGAGPGTGDGGTGHGHGGGNGNGSGPGSQATVAGRGNRGGTGYTGVIIDTLALTWPHYPTSFDVHVGSVDGPLVASISVIRYPSVAAAEASDRMQKNGRRDTLVIRPIAIEFVAAKGQGARQRVVISSGDAQRLRSSGMLHERNRIVTVYKNNY